MNPKLEAVKKQEEEERVASESEREEQDGDSDKKWSPAVPDGCFLGGATAWTAGRDAPETGGNGSRPVRVPVPSFTPPEHPTLASPSH